MEGDRIAGHRSMFSTPGVGPRNWQVNLVVASHDTHLMRKLTNGGGGDAGNFCSPLWRVLLDAINQQLKCRLGRSPIRQHEFSAQAGIGSRGMSGHQLIGVAIPPIFIMRIIGVDLIPVRIHGEQPEIVAARILVHELARVAVARNEFPVIKPLFYDLIDQG